jgi:hypothetical protein
MMGRNRDLRPAAPRPLAQTCANSRLGLNRFWAQRAQHDRDRNHAGGASGHQDIASRHCRRDTAPGSDGLVRIWLDYSFVDRIDLLRNLGESYFDVILRLGKANS